MSKEINLTTKQAGTLRRLYEIKPCVLELARQLDDLGLATVKGRKAERQK